MPEIVILDTSIFLNILDVPAFNQHRASIFDELEILIEMRAVLLLPFSAIIETGNHIAQLSDGNVRRQYAGLFCEQVAAALDGNAPWQAMRVPDAEAVRAWLAEFPDHAMRSIGMADLTIIMDWQATCERHPSYRVRVWSLDGGLEHCDRCATI